MPIHRELAPKMTILFREVDCVKIAGDINHRLANTHRNKHTTFPPILLHFTNLPWELNNHRIFLVWGLYSDRYPRKYDVYCDVYCVRISRAARVS